MALVTFSEISASLSAAVRFIIAPNGKVAENLNEYVILTEAVVAAGGQIFRRVMRTASSFAGPERLDFRS